MTRSVGQTIADSLQLSLGYTERLLTDIPADQFGRFATVGGTTVTSNHPAFIIGHLAIYPSRIVEQLGHDATAIKVSEDHEKQFGPEATCQDDPDGKIYPPMNELVGLYFKGYRQALENLQQADDQIFQEPNPREGRIKELFPTIGSMHTFYVGGHIMMHLGQLSAWRRMTGLGPA